MKVISIISLSLTVLAASAAAQRGGMPREARDTIHGLLAAHDRITREVVPTEDGYRATTTTPDAEVAKMLQKHVAQMEERMRKGLMVRRWDPAYVEFVQHYDDIEIIITHIENGVSVEGKGKTEAARRVARNHAGIISKLVVNGMAEAHKTHPAVLSREAVEPDSESPPGKKAARDPEVEEAACACLRQVGEGSEACAKPRP